MSLKCVSAIKAPVQIDVAIFFKWKMQVISCEENFPYINREKSSIQNGIKVHCVVIEDNFKSEKYQDNCNQFEKITFKVLNENDVNKFKHGELVQPYNFTKAILYGDYNNQLSIECSLMNAEAYSRNVAAQRARNVK
ncbi:hypothetical protein AB1I63_09740 [Streptococcus pneumoniae]